MGKSVKDLEDVTIRFAGDSGDGMQLAGTQFTTATAMVGNDLSTFPDYPAEIRAPAGTTYGVSGFQIRFGATDILTPGDLCDVLVAMNPAALKVNLKLLRAGGIIIANVDGFTEKNLKLAGYTSNPLEDGSLRQYEVYPINITRLTEATLEDLKLSPKVIDRTKNFFALGLMFWMFSRPMEPTIEWITKRFAKEPALVEANLRVLRAGYHYGDSTEIFTSRYRVKPAPLPPGKYRNISGNEAVALGLIAAAHRAHLQLFLGSYPITPASDILHELSRYRAYDVKTFQAEDEIAGITSALGASFAGALAATTTSGPGLSLKLEALGLAVMTELPLIVIDVQRGGPSTGLPTKTEQGDLLQAMYGRHGEAPLPVLAARSPADCFDTVFEGARIALKYMTPVIVLTDGYLGNGSEPWRIPNPSDLPDLTPSFSTDPSTFKPYLRDEKTLARPWALPGTPGLEHRIGGLEKKHIDGTISYDPDNHDLMVRLREEKIERIVNDIPPQTVDGDEEGELLVVGWGSTYGAIRSAVHRKRSEGKSVSHLHIRYLNPFPKNLGEILYRFKHILVVEINRGQLLKLLRAKYLIPALGYHRVAGLPIPSINIEQRIDEILRGER
ncbi:MAG: 2-oxoacid:acceptor oxidoreductase subunit alpha [Bacteroidota bacterium]